MSADDFLPQWEEGFIVLVSKYGCEGWVEYLLWETIEGKRKKPFGIFDPLTPEENALLINLRDVAKVWFLWQDGQWCHVPIEDWRAHADVISAQSIIDSLHNKF